MAVGAFIWHFEEFLQLYTFAVAKMEHLIKSPTRSCMHNQNSAAWCIRRDSLCDFVKSVPAQPPQRQLGDHRDLKLVEAGARVQRVELEAWIRQITGY